ncbi:hypothetical protein L195_g013594 [Trifolium pratense]|uniref:Uncharacterized protein n=1 Tax=Trifolium pratense TaxID=57577 RepID=A0A2K3PNJ6_TRIPR|nr:hypothetical protein L195_g013594 [Trifolium pratense]
MCQILTIHLLRLHEKDDILWRKGVGSSLCVVCEADAESNWHLFLGAIWFYSRPVKVIFYHILEYFENEEQEVMGFSAGNSQSSRPTCYLNDSILAARKFCRYCRPDSAAASISSVIQMQHFLMNITVLGLVAAFTTVQAILFSHSVPVSIFKAYM